MRKPLLLPIVVVLLAGCASPVKQKFPATEVDLFPERIQLSVPGDAMRVWREGVPTQKDLAHFTTEAVPAGQSLDGWRDIVVIDYWSHFQNERTVTAFAAEHRKMLTSACPAIAFELLESDRNGLMYQWSAQNCPGMDEQREIGRYIKTDNGIHRVLFAHKGEPLSESEWEEWRTAIRAATVRDIRPPGGAPLAFRRPYTPHWRRLLSEAPQPLRNPRWIMNTRTTGKDTNK